MLESWMLLIAGCLDIIPNGRSQFSNRCVDDNRVHFCVLERTQGLSGTIAHVRCIMIVLTYRHQCFAKQHEQQHVPKVRILTIWLGANDAAIPPSPQHVPLPIFVANLTRLVRLVTSPSSPHFSPSTRIIIINAPPVNTYQRGAELQSRDPPLLLDRTFETTKLYAEAATGVGEKEGIPVVDIWNAIYDAAGRDERALSQFLWDGLHLNAAGYGVGDLSSQLAPRNS